MKIIQLINTILFLCLFKIGISQNLVPNGSFENFSNCPDAFTQIYRASGWFQPNKYPGGFSVNQSSSSDYFNECATSLLIDVPSNFAGFQYAKTGTAYIGIGFYTPEMNGNAFREYAEVRLSQELEANKKYKLKYSVSLAEGSLFSITKFDAYLSQDSLLYSSLDLFKIPVTPQMQFNGRVRDTLGWVEINFGFIAAGGERFLTLGNFHDGSTCDSLTNPSGMLIGGAYYYIDDVSLEEDTLVGINEVEKIDFTIYPNPAKNSVQINSEQIIQEISIMDICSKMILQLKPLKSEVSIDVSQMAEGVYFLQCSFKNGELLHRKLVVQH